MTFLFSLLAMLMLGLTHFVNGMALKYTPAIQVAFFTHLGGAFIGFFLAFFFSMWQRDVIWWGIVAGAGSAWGAIFLYKGLSMAPFSVVVPLSSVSMMVMAILLSVIFLLEFPSLIMIAGVALAVPSLWLITGGRGVSGLRKSGASWGVVYGLGAGMGFAIQLHGLGQVEDAMALYATAIGMMIGSCFLIPFAKIKERAGVRFVVPFLAGGISVTGLALYVLSRQGQAVFASIIIVSLYPLVPVCLGAYVKNEKIGIKRKLGIFLSLLTTSLIALGNEV